MRMRRSTQHRKANTVRESAQYGKNLESRMLRKASRLRGAQRPFFSVLFCADTGRNWLRNFHCGTVPANGRSTAT